MSSLKASVLVANFNNQNFISECINSLKKQTYKNLEIIFFDDCSNDDSLSAINKYDNIKIISNKNRGEIGSFNQINAYEKAFNESSGDIIFFLDSDDYFHKNKIETIINTFVNNEKLIAIYDLPIIKKNSNYKLANNKKNFVKNFWPYLPPQSCISIKRSHVSAIFNKINFNLFPDIWMDFRIGILLYNLEKNFFILDKNLTYYRIREGSASEKFKYLSSLWWKRRMQAHLYVKYFFEKNNLIYKKNFDYFLTFIVSKLIV